ncbi:MAG: phosphopantothenate--cysteine ligase [Firmicutes bacterium]|nr:phosphopantothenate--cysteine ligase [Bacillota bacterium]
MKIVITAGGTSEPIDNVRKITNTSTGSLGLAIAKAFLSHYRDGIDRIFYLHGEKAAYPDDSLVTPITIGGTIDLMTKLEQVLKSEKIDAVVHAMAVSDYMVDEVTTVEAIKTGVKSDKISGNKISSSIDDLAIILKRTPKVISTIKPLSPGSTLVGFKLLSGVPHEELIDVATHLMEKNDCDFVLANDLSEIGQGQHKGYLIHKNGDIDTMNTKDEIGEMIARRIMEQEA